MHFHSSKKWKTNSIHCISLYITGIESQDEYILSFLLPYAPLLKTVCKSWNQYFTNSCTFQMFMEATREGNIEFISYLMQKFEWDNDFLYGGAVQRLSTDVLDWLLNKNIPFNGEQSYLATPIALDWIQLNRFSYRLKGSHSIFGNAAFYGNLPLLNWGWESIYDPSIISEYGAKGNQIRVIQWCKKIEIPLNRKCSIYATWHSNMPLLEAVWDNSINRDLWLDTLLAIGLATAGLPFLTWASTKYSTTSWKETLFNNALYYLLKPDTTVTTIETIIRRYNAIPTIHVLLRAIELENIAVQNYLLNLDQVNSWTCTMSTVNEIVDLEHKRYNYQRLCTASLSTTSVIAAWSCLPVKLNAQRNIITLATLKAQLAK